MTTVEAMVRAIRCKTTTVTFYQACGHKVTHTITADPEYGKRWIAYHKARDCPKCRQVAKAYRYELTKAGRVLCEDSVANATGQAGVNVEAMIDSARED